MSQTMTLAQPSASALPSMQLSALCQLIVKQDDLSTAAKKSAQIARKATQPTARYTKPTAWVYESLYDELPKALVFSPTTGLSFYLPISESGQILFEEARYLEKSFSALTRNMRSGSSVLDSDIGETAPIPEGSLANWIERTLLNASAPIQ